MESAYWILESRRECRRRINLGELSKERVKELWGEMRRFKEKGIVKTWKHRKNFKVIMKFTL